MYLLVGDLHLTDRPRDAYRFGIFEWIAKQQEKYRPKVTYLMGDLCDKKDNHSSQLVNRIVEEVGRLKPPIDVVMGNHDYIDPTHPFFRFLNTLEGVNFVTQPTCYEGVAIIPHMRDERAFETVCKGLKAKKLDLLLVHTTFSGAIAETGAVLSGFSLSPIEFLRPRLGVYAGDVHRPQTCGPVTYVGAPYHIRFGDSFKPRCILLDDDGQAKNLYFEAPYKWALTVRDASELLNNQDIDKGDQIKVTVELAREEAVEWQTHKQQVLAACEKLGVQVFGIDLKVNSVTTKRKRLKESAKGRSYDDVMQAFCTAEGVASQVRATGLSFLRE